MHNGISGEEKRGLKTLKEIMAENLPNLRKETDIQVKEAQKPPLPPKMNPNKPTIRHIIIKIAVRERFLLSRSKNRVTKGTHLSLSIDFSTKGFRPEESDI